MCRMYLDCEFNSQNGELISIALAADNNTEFYGVVGVPHDVDPWVAEHVVPVINQAAVGLEAVRQALYAYLRQFDSLEIVADWPADFVHLFALLNGKSYLGAYAPNLTAVLCPEAPVCPTSTTPHNALSDARALRDAWQVTG